MDTTIALITGANKGIGFETARGLKAKGVTVLLGARDEERGSKAAEELGVQFVRLDVTDEANIAAAAKQVEADHGRLDVLINNAGITGQDGLPSQTPVAVVREVYETNVFGVVAATNAFLPLLRRSAAGRVVNVSSELGAFAWVTDTQNEFYGINLISYNTSKSALNAVTVAYAKELADTGIKVNAVTPGYCATDLNGHSGFRTPEQGSAVCVKLALIGNDGPTGGFFNDEGALDW
jgi:NAD(P)-dependent dehydrogenase (short-subunit alcohol dehydrogenase family)